MMGTVLAYKARKRLQVHCPDCGLDLTAGSLAVQRQTQKGVGLGAQWKAPYPPPPPTHTHTRGILRYIRYHLRAWQGRVNYQSRGARGGQRYRQGYMCTYYIITCRTLW